VSLLGRAKSLFGRWAGNDQVALHTDAIARDHLDNLAWQDVRNSSPAIAGMIEDLREHYDYAEDLTADFFAGVLQHSPNARLAAEMAPSHRPHAAVLKDVLPTEEFQQLRQLTEGDPYDAAMALMSMRPTLEKVLERSKESRDAATRAAEAREKAREAAEAAQQVAQNAEQAQQQAEQAQQDADANPDDQAAQDAAQQAQEQSQQAQQQAEDACQLGEQLGDQAQQADDSATAVADNVARGVRREMRQAAQQAENERSEEGALMQAFGVGDGQLERMSFQERFELAQRLRGSRLAKFASFIGAFRMVASQERRRKVQHAVSEAYDVELTNNLSMLLPAEYVNMCTPELEDDFWRRYVQGQLMTYKVRGTEELGKGAIVAVVDESGTMSTEDMAGGVTRECWSKAFALALLDQARAGKRDFVYIGFSSARQQHVVRFPKGQGDLLAVMEMTEHFYNGGTHFETPLRQAAELLVDELATTERVKGDVVFITDGVAPIGPEFLKQWIKDKAAADFRCFGVAVSGESNTASIEAVSDNTRSIMELTCDPTAMADVFRVV
jgi:uncharacterized protein with von Willebrand factor type A (vWA) domain